MNNENAHTPAPRFNVNDGRTNNGFNGTHPPTNGTAPPLIIHSTARPVRPPGDELSLSDLRPLVSLVFAQLRARWWAGLLAAIAIVGGLGWLAFRGVPEYTAVTSVVAQSPLGKILNVSEGAAAPADNQRQESNLRNHLAVMTSRSFRQKVAEGLSEETKLEIQAPYLKPGDKPSPELLDSILAGNISVERERGREFFTIKITHRTPAIALALADRFSSEYIEYVQDEFRVASRSAVEILQKQAQALTGEIRALEDERREYRKTFGLISVEENQSIISERLRRINAALSDVRVQRVGLEIQLRQAQADLAASPTPFNNPALATFGSNQVLRVDLEQLRSQREVLATQYGPNHPKMLESGRLIEGLERTIAANFQLAIADLKAKYDLAVSSEQQLNNELTQAFNQSLDIDKLSGTFNTLGDQLAAKQKTQSALLQRIAQTGFNLQMPSDAMRVVDAAYLVENSMKRRILIGLFILGLGAVAFVGTPMLLYMFDERLSASADLENVLGKELLGAIPRLSRTRAEDRPHIVRDNVDFASVECFLSVVGQLDLISKKPVPKRILITSTLPGEGKSMVASNLAATFTRLGRNTVIVDCDFRRPTQQNLHQSAGPGGILSWAEAGFPVGDDIFAAGGILGMRKLPDGTSFIPVGGVDTQPTRHLIAPAIAAFFERLGEKFDIVIVDTPPAGVFQDALILAKYCHETILIAREGKAETAQVKRVVGELEKTPSPAIGVVLNAFSPGSSHPHMAYRHMAEKYGYGYGNKPVKKTKLVKARG